MGIRVGGLLISRKPGETISLFFGRDKAAKILRYDYIDKDGACHINFDGIRYDMYPGESILVGDDSFYLESVEGGRAVFRMLFSDQVRILRSELLGTGIENAISDGNGQAGRPNGARERKHPKS